MSRIRILPILIILAIALSVLFGGWELYRKFGLVRPLEEQLKTNAAVTEVETVVTGSEREIKVTLKPVTDLQATYEDLEKTVVEQLGDKQVKIDLVDTRADELKDAYRSLQPTLYAGIAQGNFPQMIADVQKEAEQAGLKSHVSMNDQYIFVQLQQGEQYLYEVLPYKTMTAERLLGVSSL